MKNRLLQPHARLLKSILTLLLGLLSTSAYTAKQFQPDALWPQLTQSGRYFDFPSGVTRDAQGLFYITDTGSNKIKVLTAEGGVIADMGWLW